ncbi:Lrp/AsnC family transcriptional regulator [Cognatishimia sp. SS12]|uniref:Lrp/AsnC family transcriptional regulator n=1 Tax=Cognatishimia sp. SS12 TaxID=2979465 RepID=UPI00232FCF13|nr:Lrp/AsnC family transcriptional regulator [Cognatishimia sp. SS12]MDC0736702.1 Lrp/AsnC family transcriptional regulator [Cognatishimia sp. SS12]
MEKIDETDRRILDAIQRDAGLSQRGIAEKVGLSQNALWRRLKRLEEAGFMQGERMRLDATRLGLDLTVFVMIRTRNHSVDWAEKFRAHVARIPEVAEMHRIGGDWDYMLKVVTRGMAGYDRAYRRITTGFELDTVTGLFSMETMLEDRPLSLHG